MIARDTPDPAPAPPMHGRARTVVFWAVIAATNLTAGAAITSWPDRQRDLRRVAEWCRLWLGGADIYTVRTDLVDYPPHAIVFLSPLGWLGSCDHLVLIWTAVNLALAPLAAYLAVLVVRPKASLRAAAVPMLLFLCWGGFRTLLQFSLLALTCGLASIVLARRRPIWSGVLLGLSMMKPQIALPFALWMLAERRWRQTLAALVTVAAGYAVFCVRAGAWPLRVAVEYRSILATLYTGEESMRGLAQLRPLIAALTTDWRAVDVASGLVAAALLAGIAVMAASSQRPRDTLAVLSLGAVWSLLTFYHLSYGFLILMPVAASLWFPAVEDGRLPRHRLFWLLQLALMFDLTTVWRWLGSGSHRWPRVDILAAHADRLLAVVLFGMLALGAWQSRRDGPGGTLRPRG